MATDKKILSEAKKVLRIEAEAVKGLLVYVNRDFVKAVKMLYLCKGRVIVTGMGKAGIIARKISATLASTGTPALFMHPAEGVHGDLGTVLRNDVVIIVSNSGETEEVLDIMPAIKRIGARVIALTGGKASTLAKNSDITVCVAVKEEACPLGLAPTASTTAELAMGDALAVALLIKRGFKEKDYALLHPAGSLGRMLARVEDIMRKGEEIPAVRENMLMSSVIVEMTVKKTGCTAVLNSKGKLSGIITDQDLRMHLKNEKSFLKKKARDIMTRNPKTIHKDALVSEAVRLTEEKSISTLLVVDRPGELIGIIHLHDLLKLK
ncbi:MAG: KpsF/GutQ family sugar-phosphate isomerase [Candidatus Firestonebacteria bacterium]